MLASAQRILDLQPIENADTLEVASVLGWQVVVKKGYYKVGDLVAYIQIDTIVPDNELFDFLRERKFRVRTIKLRGQISQGLIVPLFDPENKYKEGDDLTKELGVRKYEKPAESEMFIKPRMPKAWYKKLWYRFKYNFLFKFFPVLRKKEKSPFPKHLVPITDEQRIQNIPGVLKTYQDRPFVVSYKLNGSSITIIHEKFLWMSKFRICSRNWELHDKHNAWYKAFVNTGFAEHIKNLVEYYETNDIIVQGELIGPKFNGNYHNVPKDEIRVFNIYVNKERIQQDSLIFVCKYLDIPHCPLYHAMLLNHSMEEILSESNIPDVINPAVPAEGLVWRSISHAAPLSFKVINNNYLIKNEE
jgi:hypothetical protein